MSGDNGEHGVFSFIFTVEISVIIYDFLVASMLECFTLVQRVDLQFVNGCFLDLFNQFCSFNLSNFQKVLLVPFIV